MPFTPDSIVAGRVPYGSGRPEEAAFHAAAAALDTDRVRLVVHAHDEMAWYIAAPAEDFSSEPDSGTSLACAFPGRPGHLGPAVYVTETPTNAHAAVGLTTDGRLICFVGSDREITTFAQKYGLERYTANSDARMRWVGFAEFEERQVRKLQQQMSHLGMAVFLSGAALFFGLHLLAGHFESKAFNYRQLIAAHIHTFSQMTNDIAVSPASQQMSDLQQLARKTLTLGGRIRIYQISGERSYWQAEFPPFVTADAIRTLGSGLDMKVEGNVVIVTKGVKL